MFDPDPIIKIKNLQYAYPDGTVALEGVSLNIALLESVAIIGANGAGKSTLLSHLNGVFLSDHPNEEHGVFFEGEPIRKKTLLNVRNKVGMVFQNPDDQLFMINVFEDVAFGLRNKGIPEADIERGVMRALQSVGMTHMRDRSPHRLSGGEKRLISIATVLVMEPDVLILDEPSSNLDPRARRSLIQLLNRLNQVKLIATHDLDLVLDVCERTVIMKNGRVMADGPTYEIMRNKELLEACHLEQPIRVRYEDRF